MSRQLPVFFKKVKPSPHLLALQVFYALEMGIVDKADEALNEALASERYQHFSPQARGLASMLVNEACRWFLTLKTHIKRLTQKRFKDHQAPLRHLLCLGLLSVLHPQERNRHRVHSQVHAWIDLAKEARLSASQVALLNACLRNASEGGVPLGELPSDFKGSLFEAESFQSAWPLWAIEALHQSVSSDKVQGYLNASHIKQPLTLFHTQARSDAEMQVVLQALAQEKISVTPVFHDTFPNAIHLSKDFQGCLSDFPHFDEGHWYVQDYGSAWVAQHACQALQTMQTPQPVVVDLCAAPGSKTWWLAQAVKDKGHVHAVELSDARCKRLIENLHRLHLQEAVTIHTQDARTFTLDGSADLILVDAPCSALGTISHHPDLWMQKSEASLKTFPPLQLEILKQASTLAHRDSILMYSTCTWLPTENETLIQRFLAEHPEWYCVDMKRLPLHPEHDAFFLAILKQQSPEQ